MSHMYVKGLTYRKGEKEDFSGQIPRLKVILEFIPTKRFFYHSVRGSQRLNVGFKLVI